MKKITCIQLLLLAAYCPWTINSLAQPQPMEPLLAQPQPPPPPLPKPTGPTAVFTETSDDPQALVRAVRGKCEYSENGTTFAELKVGHVFLQGAVVRTGDGGQIDLFFRRIGTSVRLQSGTEIKLEKMERHMKDGKPVMDTLLDLRTGRIFTVVRSLVPGCTLEIRNAAGRSVVEGGGGNGRYIITADGTHVTEKNSKVPLKLIRETGVTVIEPGMKYSSKEGKVFAVAPSEALETLVQLDELDSLTEQMSAADEPPKAK